MKPKKPFLRHLSLSLIACALGGICQTADAAAYTWDLSTTAGTQTGSGVWSTSDANWSANGTTLTAWLQTSATASLHTATLAGADGTHAITLGTDVAAQSITFSNSGYTLGAASARTLTLTNVGNAVISVASGKAATIGSNATVAFNAQSNTGARIDLTTGASLDIAAGGTLTRTGQVTTGFSATGGTLGFMGSGTLNVAGTLSFNVGTPVANGGIVLAANAGNSNILNVNGGTVSSNSTNNGLSLVGSGTSGTLNLASGLVSTTGTAAVTAGINLANGAGTTGTVNLNGGTISTYQVNSNYLNGSNVLTTGGTSTFNFNGGTLKAIAANAAYMTGLTAANVKAGGASIDTDSFAITIGQGLLHDSGLGGTPDGGLTKVGDGMLTLTGASTYTGATSITSGTLLLGGTGAINGSSGITLNGTGAKLIQTSSTASTPAVNLQNGGLDGTGTLGAVTVSDNAAATIANGNGGGAALTVGALTFNGDATLNLSFGASTPLVVTGALTTTPANGQVILNVPSPVPNGLVNLIGFGSFTGSASNFTANFSNLGARQVAGALQLNGSNIASNITGEAIVWSGVTNDVWDTGTTGSHTGPNNWARKAATSPTNFWTNDAVEFNDTYNVGAGNIPVSRNMVLINAEVAPISTTFNNNSVAYVIDSLDLLEKGISTGSLTKNGTAVTTLVGYHTYPGGTIINAGTLQLGNSTFDGTIANTASVTNNGTLRYHWESPHTAPYPISGTGGLEKEGSGILTLSGTNTSSGTTSLLEGGITLQGNGGIGSGALSVAAGTTFNLAKTYTLGQVTTGAGTIVNSGGTASLSGNFSGFTGSYHHSTAIASTLINSSSAASANAAYEITIGNAASQGIILNITAGNNTLAFGSLSGVANSLVRNAAAVTGVSTLEIGNLNTNTEFAGGIGGGGGTLAVTKVGTGTLTLSGANTYNGATHVNAGTLAFATTPNVLSNSSFTVANGANLQVKASAAGTTMLTTNSLTLGASSLTFDFNSLNPTVTRISTEALTFNGAAGMTFLNANALATGTYKLIDYGTLSGSGSFPGGSIAVGTRGVATIVNNVIDTSIDLQVTSDTPKWTGLDNGNWVVGTTGANKNWKLAVAGTATDYIDGDNVLFDDSATGSTSVVVDAMDVNPLSTTFNNSSKNYSITGNFGIASGSLIKSGTGTLTLLNSNIYSGSTTIQAGTLQLGNGTLDGTIAFTAAVTNNGTLAYNWAGDHTANYVISGSGVLTKSGAGNLMLAGNNTYSGGTSLIGGTTTLTGEGTLGTGVISLAAGTTLNINKNLPLTNTVTGTGSIINTGTTTVTGDFTGFTGNFSHNSTVVSMAFNTAITTSPNASYHIASAQGGSQGMIAGGNGDYTLKLGSLSGVANSLFRGGNTATGTTTLEIGGLGTSTVFEGSINNGLTKTLALTKVGAGTLTVSGVCTYTGTTMVTGGTLNINGSLAAASVVTVTSGGTLSGIGTVPGIVIAGGTVAPGNGAGTLATGPTTLTGTLAIEINGATGDKLLSSGAIDLSAATLTVTPLSGGFTEASYVIAEGTSITGPFASVPSGYSVSIVSGGAGQQAILTAAGGGYASWAATNANGQASNLDQDLDGVKNGVEYFMNATPGFTGTPGIVAGAITWKNGGNIPASAYGTEFTVQTSPDLTSPWTDVPAASLTTNTSGPNGSLTYTLPTGLGKLFVRLKVTPN